MRILEQLELSTWCAPLGWGEWKYFEGMISQQGLLERNEFSLATVVVLREARGQGFKTYTDGWVFRSLVPYIQGLKEDPDD